MDVEIKIKNLKKKYPNPTESLKGINLEIAQRQFFALLGPNGASKSSLVKILTTLIKKMRATLLLEVLTQKKTFRLYKSTLVWHLRRMSSTPKKPFFYCCCFRANYSDF